MKESTTYQAIVREGREEGRDEGRTEEARRMLLLVGETKFGRPEPQRKPRSRASLTWPGSKNWALASLRPAAGKNCSHGRLRADAIVANPAAELSTALSQRTVWQRSDHGNLPRAFSLSWIEEAPRLALIPCTFWYLRSMSSSFRLDGRSNTPRHCKSGRGLDEGAVAGSRPRPSGVRAGPGLPPPP